MIRTLRFRLGTTLFDIATWICPKPLGRGYGEAYHVGNKWVDWRVMN